MPRGASEGAVPLRIPDEGGAFSARGGGARRICQGEDKMTKDLEQARRMLEGENTCVVCREDTVYTAT